MLTYSETIQDTILNGGGTYKPDLSGKYPLPDNGFIVSISDQAKVHLLTAKKSEVTKAFQDAIDNNAKQYPIGTWIDNNILYIDYVMVAPTRKQAEDFCKLHDQQAYYDIAAKNSIKVADGLNRLNS